MLAPCMWCNLAICFKEFFRMHVKFISRLTCIRSYAVHMWHTYVCKHLLNVQVP